MNRLMVVALGMLGLGAWGCSEGAYNAGSGGPVASAPTAAMPDAAAMPDGAMMGADGMMGANDGGMNDYGAVADPTAGMDGSMPADYVDPSAAAADPTADMGAGDMGIDYMPPEGDAGAGDPAMADTALADAGQDPAAAAVADPAADMAAAEAAGADAGFAGADAGFAGAEGFGEGEFGGQRPRPEDIPDYDGKLFEPRTWTDASGQFKIEAEFVKFAAGQVTLKKTDGAEITLPNAKLSADDQAFIRTELAEKRKIEKEKDQAAKPPRGRTPTRQRNANQ